MREVPLNLAECTAVTGCWSRQSLFHLYQTEIQNTVMATCIHWQSKRAMVTCIQQTATQKSHGHLYPAVIQNRLHSPKVLKS